MVKLIPRELREASFPEARFLNNEEQARYNEVCKRFGKKARQTLNVPLKGSNLFKVLFLNELGITTATISELGLALENGLDLKRTYEDGREVVLRSAGDLDYQANDYIAKSLAKLIRKRSFKHPLIIKGLRGKEDENSVYGLSFAKTDELEVIEAPDFSHKNNCRRFIRVNPDYSIDFGDEGNKTLYTRQNGVSGLDVDGGGYLGSDGRGLAGSNDAGRVVVVSGEAT